MRLAIIDDDRGFVRQVSAAAQSAGIASTNLLAAQTPPRFLRAGRLDAALIDPDALGAPAFWDWLEAVGRRLPELSVLVCSGRTDLASRVRGLRLGADDWITKPAAANEVVARVEASRRRHRVEHPAGDPDTVWSGELEIRPARRGGDARASGRQIGLTPREFELLHFLACEAGMVHEREAIYQRVWGYAMVSGDRSVDTYIRKLRIKLEAASPGWAYIHTHFGIGYRFEAQLAEGASRYRWESQGEGPSASSLPINVDDPDAETLGIARLAAKK